jgi:transcriptional regulator with XRE-family HTH domain
MSEDRDLHFYLDAAAKRIAQLYSLPKISDRELAKRLSVGASTLNNWRTGRSLPEDAMMAQIAERGGQDVEVALLDLSAWRSEEPARSVYSNLARRLGRSAAAFFCPLFLAGGLAGAAAIAVKPLPAEAAVHGTLPAQTGAAIESNLYYGKYRRRLWRRIFSRLAKALRWAALAAALGLGATPATAESPRTLPAATAESPRTLPAATAESPRILPAATAENLHEDPHVGAHMDPWGRPYPTLCSRAALAGVKIPVIRVSQAFLDKATRAENRYGVFLPTGAMAVRDDLEGELLQGVIDHEACHWLIREATGSPDWHRH